MASVKTGFHERVCGYSIYIYIYIPFAGEHWRTYALHFMSGRAAMALGLRPRDLPHTSQVEASARPAQKSLELARDEGEGAFLDSSWSRQRGTRFYLYSPCRER